MIKSSNINKYVLSLLLFWLKHFFLLWLKKKKPYSIGLGISTKKKHRLTMHDSKQYLKTCWKEKKLVVKSWNPPEKVR